MMRTRKGYKVYPLTVAQRFHLFYLPYSPTAAVLNIGTSLTIVSRRIKKATIISISWIMRIRTSNSWTSPARPWRKLRRS